jgi:hypothetical protein
MEKDPPITDKDNFPRGEGTEKPTAIGIDMTSIAYYDGLAEGYRKAARDFMLFALLFSIATIFVRSQTRA